MLCQIITEGMVGTENQCVGVANAIGLSSEIKQIGLNQPWRALSPWLPLETSFTFSPKLTPPWPDLLIVSGRKSIAAARYIKKQNSGVFTVYIQNPKINPLEFDLVAAPYHDNLTGPNVIVTDGAPNKITPTLLEKSKIEFTPLFDKTFMPRLAILIGGNSRTHKMTQEKTIAVSNRLKELSKDYFLMITASRRTGDENIKILKETLTGENIYFYDGNGPNPYLGMLAWADKIIVTNDSVSMLSDAGTTGKPVYTIELDGTSKRFTRLYDHLSALNVIRPLPQNGNLDHWKYEPLADAQKIATAIKVKMG